VVSGSVPDEELLEAVDVRLPGKGNSNLGKREFKLPWREAGPPNHHDDKVDSDQ